MRYLDDAHANRHKMIGSTRSIALETFPLPGEMGQKRARLTLVIFGFFRWPLFVHQPVIIQICRQQHDSPHHLPKPH